MANSVNSVNISVEALVETTIHEITYDGTEIYQPPLSLSEHLSKCAAKIDFSKSALKETEAAAVKKEAGTSDDDTKEAASAALWPWDSVRNKLRDAYTEICVLSDVLAIAKAKQYMVLDPVPQDYADSKPIVQVYARKKALSNAATVLLSGADRLRSSHMEQKNSRSASEDFHIDLLRLRQNWRLKKVGNTIIGDLSYRTAGSKFMYNGNFEVTKAEDEPPSSPPPSPGPSGAASTSSTPASSSSLRVNVPTELQGVAYIKVITQKDQADLCTANVNLLGHGSNINQQAGVWQKTLEFAQNVLFCKELFQQLAKEAVQLQAPIPHVVVGNQIRATLLPGIQLVISLCHTTSSDTPIPGPISDHDHVLEHSLHQLLRDVHHRNTHLPFPHPASGPFGPSKKRMLAGPMAADRYELMEMAKSQTLLEQIIAQAQHIFMQRRTKYVLDTLAKDVKDPHIISHWNTLNNPTMSCVKVNIITLGYDTVCRTPLLIHVMERSLKCICRDGRVMHLSYEPQELRDLILYQINQHQITALGHLSKCMGWQVLSNSNHMGIGSVEPLGNASSCMLASPKGDRILAVQIRCDPQVDVKVSVAHSPRKDFFPGPLVQGNHWEHLGTHFKEVRYDKLEGRNFLNRMEYLMAAASAERNGQPPWEFLGC